MKKSRVPLIILASWLLLLFVVVAVFGWSRSDNKEFQPQNEFKLETWINLPGPFDINKGVLYVVLAGLLTVATWMWIANRMQARPNRTQTAIETLYALMRDNITSGNMDRKMASKWFVFVATLFLFIWYSNLIGYIPLPTNSGEKFDLFGVQVPAFALFAATANISVPLALALISWLSYNIEGVRAKGFVGYIKGLIPAGVPGWLRPIMLVLELLSHFMRLISLSVRLFANILAGHLIILFMAGGLVVLLGIEGLGVVTLPFGFAIFLFEVGLVATLQAFIFATLTAIYLGEATAEHH
jgi:F-type H+-transporting ATPase subunit a